MNSKDLEQHGFKGWYPLSQLTISDVPYGREGVYIIKSKVAQKRKMACSDILYIGSSNNLTRRIFGNYVGNIGYKTTHRIHKLLFEDKYLWETEVGWITLENFDKLEKYLEGTIKWPSATKHEELEKRLKLKFKKEHDNKYPPWNKVL